MFSGQRFAILAMFLGLELNNKCILVITVFEALHEQWANLCSIGRYLDPIKIILCTLLIFLQDIKCKNMLIWFMKSI